MGDDWLYDVEIEVLGKPVGKGRPRFSNAGGFVRTYTPDKTVDFENLVRLEWHNAGHEMLHGCIAAKICACFPIPKSVSKKKRATMDCAPYPHKPDCDNIAKAVLDALNGIAYDDDSQVVELIVQKKYSDTPKTIIKFCEFTEE